MLKDCPFCNGNDVEVLINNDFHFAVFCHHCCCSGPIMDSRKDAIKSWNKRLKSEDDYMLEHDYDRLTDAGC